jgi:phosphoglycolate phosphatase-like HAD superfamily hydrolase
LKPLPVLAAPANAGDCPAISVDDAQACPLYVGRALAGVQVGPSPGWLAAKLEADLAGIGRAEAGAFPARAVAAPPEARGRKVLLVGDTLHDHEAAVSMGCRCVLFAGGHQSRDRLASTGVPVVDALEDIVQVI